MRNTDGNSNHSPSKQTKGVRFKESFSTIPRPPSPPVIDDLYNSETKSQPSRTDNESGPLWGDHMRHPTSNTKNNVVDNNICDSANQDINNVPISKPGNLINNKYAFNNETTDQVKLRKNSHPPLQRRYSNESLISNNSVMLHTGTLIHANAIDDLALNQQQYPNKSVNHNMAVPSQPDRPAPVLKPAVGRKPSLDRTSIFQIRKQQSLAQQRQLSDKSSCANTSQRPTYEDTLKKCQSLTRHHSSPPSPNPSMNGLRQDTAEKINATRQMSCPTTSMSTPNSPGLKYTAIGNNHPQIGASPLLSKRLPSPPKSPAIPPKPDLALMKLGYTNRPIKDDSNTKNVDAVTHLPPSGNQPHLPTRTLENTQPKTIISLAPHSSAHLGYSPLPIASNSSSSVMAPLNNRQHQLNQAFLNDLHLAMSAKLASQDSKKNVVEELLSSVGNHHHQQKIVNASVNNWLMNQTSMNNGRPPNTMECESPPFPVNRFSNGEYDNIQNNNSVSTKSPSAMSQNIKPNHLIKPSGVARVVKSQPSTNIKNSDSIGQEVGSSRPPIVSNTQRVKKMAPPPPPLAKRTKENEKSYSNWKRS